MSLGGWLAEQAELRSRAGLVRTLRPRGSRDCALDLAGNDYLGLSTHPRVTSASAQAAERWGAGAGASRLVTGTLAVHQDLEVELASFCGQPAALVFSSGYLANLGLVAALADRETLVVSDAHVHASLVDGCRLSRAVVRVVAHNDTAAVAAALAQRAQRRALVLTESVFSVLGDAAPLDELAIVSAQHDAVLVVDEAHALGVAGIGGRGLVHASGLAGAEHVVVTATLSKSLGSQGGVALGPVALRDHLVNAARPFVYDTGLAPAAAAGALAALRVLVEEPERATAARQCAAALAGVAGLDSPAAAVLSVPMPRPGAALAAQARCLEAGLHVGCFRPPSVPDGISRLRLTGRATLAGDQLGSACDLLRAALGGAP